MRNTIEGKQRYIAAHWRQDVIIYKNEILFVMPETIHVTIIHNAHLLLTPLSMITDEHAIEVFDMLFGHSETHREKPQEFKIDLGKSWGLSIFTETYGYYYPKSYIQMLDFLISKGYALPWMGISVEELVKRGWLKLKTK